MVMAGPGTGDTGKILALAHVRNLRENGLLQRPCYRAASPPQIVLEAEILNCPAMAASGELESSSLGAKGERKGPCLCSRKSLRVRNAPFTLSMERCSCPLLKRERGPSLLVQGKERGPCGERNLL